MGESLVIRDGALLLDPSGRALVTSTGGAPCCCGGTEPCAPAPGCPNCVNSPQCLSSGLAEVYRVWNRPPGQTGLPTVIYSINRSCCCTNVLTDRYYWLEIERVDTVTGPLGPGECGHSRTTLVGQGVPQQFQIRRTTTFANCNGVTPPTQDVLFPPSSYPCGPGPGFPATQYTPLPLNGATTGYQRITCDIEESFKRRILFDTANGRTFDTTERILRRVQRNPEARGCNPCASLGACCCSGVCYPGHTQAQCQAMGGDWWGAGSGCADRRCGPPSGTSDPSPGGPLTPGGIGGISGGTRGCSSCGGGIGL